MIEINIFDSNFSPNYSVAYQTPEHVQYVQQQMKWPPRMGITMFTDEWINSPSVDQVESHWKVGWLHEPMCLHPQTYEHALENLHKFDLMLTYSDTFMEQGNKLDECECMYSPYGGIWIDQSKWGMYEKSKNISMLFGMKMSTDGHLIRHKIYDLLNTKFPIDFYGAHGITTNYSAETKELVHRDYRYSIVCETCRENGLFTEILLDCFVMGTIPIFWGAPDIGDYFDNRAILSFSTLNELWEIMRVADDKYYEHVKPYAKANLMLAGEYRSTEDWLWSHYFKEMT